jgi:hypothetical protein
MAQVKHNTVGTSKCMEVYIRFGKKCFACEKPQTYKEAQIEHIHPRQLADSYPNGKENINESANLCILCKSCNSSKFLQSASEFYTAEKFATLVKLQSYTIDKQQILAIGDTYAMANPTSKFAKLHRSGLYWEASY